MSESLAALPVGVKCMSRPGSHSISHLIEGLKQGDSAAEFHLWDRVIVEAVAEAKKQLLRTGSKRRVADEDDVAARALGSLIAGAREGNYPQIVDREGFRSLLREIIRRKALNCTRDERAIKRGRGRVRGESAFNVPTDDSAAPGIQGAGDVPRGPVNTDDVVRLIYEQFEELDEHTLNLAILKFSGHTNVEIATMLGLSLATTERRANDLRRIWEQDSLLDLLADLGARRIGLSDLKPTPRESELILETTSQVNRVMHWLCQEFDAYDERFRDWLLLGTNRFQPVSVSTGELRSKRNHSFPGDYSAAVAAFRRGVRFWGVYRPEQDPPDVPVIHSFVWVDRRWIFIPEIGAALHS